MSGMDELIRSRADELDSIVFGETYQEYTALGFLIEFAREVEAKVRESL